MSSCQSHITLYINHSCSQIMTEFSTYRVVWKRWRTNGIRQRKRVVTISLMETSTLIQSIGELKRWSWRRSWSLLMYCYVNKFIIQCIRYCKCSILLKNSKKMLIFLQFFSVHIWDVDQASSYCINKNKAWLERSQSRVHNLWCRPSSPFKLWLRLLDIYHLNAPLFPDNLFM